MNQQTQVKSIKLKTRATRLLREPAEIAELSPKENGWGARLLQLDKLTRNLAVAGGLVLVVIAVRNSSVPEAQSVFGAIQQSVGMQWDESLGKLSFVNSLLPEEIAEVWSQTNEVSVFAPVEGAVVHAWSQNEPYLLISSVSDDVRACSSGEVMSIAHGVDEELILRVRHEDDTEAIYGNLLNCYAEVGDSVYAGDSIGTLLSDLPLAFEIRSEGRSIDPTMHMKRFDK